MRTTDTSIDHNQATLNEDGRIILPIQLDESVQLIPHDDFKITVNGEEISQLTLVSKADEIIVTNNMPKVKPGLTITVAQDKLSASMKLQPYIKVTPNVIFENTNYGPQVKILSEEHVQCPFTLQKLLAALQEKGVVYGIDQQALADILAQLDGEKTVVARGEKPQPGVDESVTVLFNTKADNHPAVLPDGRVDYKQSQITSVDLGQVLAVKLAGQPGKAGIGVDGNPIDPPDYKRVELRAGARTMLQQNGTSVVALESGMPSLTVTQNIWTFQVTPMLEFDDVNLSTGNLEFNGDLRIKKDVAEGMAVFATGNIDIVGSVYGAKVMTLGNLTVNKNVTSSFITAGGMSDYLIDIKEKLCQINKRMTELYVVLQVLQKKCQAAGQDVNCGRMVGVVIEKKFTDLPLAIDELDKLSKEENIVQGNLKSIINQLVATFRSLGMYKIKEFSEIYQLQRRLAATISTFDALEDNNGDIQLGYAINSTIEASGEVRVSGKGCINTTINARGMVQIDAIFRGGVINSKGTVRIKEAGSEIGVKTVIRTAGQPIFIEKAYPNVTITSGLNSKTTNNVEYKVYLKDD